MAVDYFLKIDGIKGESEDEKHKDEIEIIDFTWSEEQSHSFAQGGGGGGGKIRKWTTSNSARSSTAPRRR